MPALLDVSAFGQVVKTYENPARQARPVIRPTQHSILLLRCAASRRVRADSSHGPKPFRCNCHRRWQPLLPELADENIDDLAVGLVRAAIQMIEKYRLAEPSALAQGKQLEHVIFFSGRAAPGCSRPRRSWQRGSRCTFRSLSLRANGSAS